MISKNKTKEFLYLVPMQIQDQDKQIGIMRINSVRPLMVNIHPIPATITLFILLCLALSISSAAEKKEPLRLIRADKLEQFYRADVPVKKLTGNVLFQKGELQLACDLAFWYEKDQRADFFRHVVASKGSKILTADSLIYFNEPDSIVARGKPVLRDSSISIKARVLTYLVEDEIAHAQGKVFLEDSNRTVQANLLHYYSQEKKSVALGQAILHDTEKRTSLAADSLLYFNSSGNIEALIRPVLTRFDSTGAESFRIRGDTIRLAEKEGNFLADGNVQVWRTDFTAYSKTLNYVDSLEIATLTDHPRVLSDGQELTGKLMRLRFQDEKISALFIDENARANATGKAYLPADSTGKTRGDSIPTYDEITGKFMEIYFREGQADSILVSGMATSLYNVSEDSIIQGVNEVSGDTIQMKFADKKISTIIVIGGTQGRYVPNKTNTNTDTTVVYSAERINYFVDRKVTDLYRNAAIQSGDMELTAGKINVRWDENLLYANPLNPPPYDSSGGDFPTLNQKGREPFAGESMVYNLKTQRGRIVEGKTKEQDGFYYGENISKVDKKVFYVSQGVYTTCDLPNPHYYFRSKQMKLIFKDKIIARPIIFYIHDIPLLGLPFLIIPDRGGQRQSGWIMPAYGENNSAGGFIRGLGYFWAPSDYYDFRLTGDFYDKQGVILDYRLRYAWRYKFDGSISGKFTNDFFTNYPERQWTFNISHNQPINPTTRLSVNGKFVSSESLYKKYRYDLADRLDQQLISNATFSKSWAGKPYSLSVNFNQTVNLQAKALSNITPTTSNQKISYISRSLPNISFTRSSKPLVALQANQDATKSKWYNNIYFSTSSYLKNSQSIYYQSNDSLEWEEYNIKKSAMTHNFSFNTSQKLLGFLTTSQNLNLDEGWVMEYAMPVVDDSGRFVLENNAIKTRTVQGFKARHTGSTSLSAQTKLYGLFPVRIGGLQAIRHVMTPSLSMTFRPDFTKEVFGWDPGYVIKGIDTANVKRTFDPLASTMLGSISSSQTRTLSMGLSNLVQAKLGKGDKTRKMDLFSLNSSTGYNFAADSLRWSNISTSFRTQVTKKIAINLSAIHDLYAYRNGRRVNQWNDTWNGIPVPRLTSVSASTGFALSGKRFGAPRSATTSPDTTALSDTTGANLLSPELSSAASSERLGEGSYTGSELWSASFSLRYSLSQYNPTTKNESFWMSMNLKLNLTSKWKVGYAASFNLLEKKLVNHSISITRDLHCWQLAFNWTPSGYGKQYSLLINIKSPSLSDLKYEERGGRRSNLGW
ncbi:MAG: putative LPS assembly protein LptD [Candidatus Neomarinimicrobiota bacterium]